MVDIEVLWFLVWSMFSDKGGFFVESGFSLMGVWLVGLRKLVYDGTDTSRDSRVAIICVEDFYFFSLEHS